MTRTSGAPPVAELVRAHGADLHRLAAMLTADPWDATDLTARVLAAEARRDGGGGPTDPAAGDRLKQDLVRQYLRSVPRRPEGVDTPGGDAGDALRRLRPGARAAAALRLVEGWDTDRTAAAVGVPRRRLSALVPSVPGLDLALTALADQHAPGGEALEDALLEAVTDGPVSGTRDRGRRWGWLAAAVVPSALLVGYVVDDRGDESARTDGQGPPAGAALDLTDAGWRLDDDGDPPRAPMGMLLRDTVVLDDGRRSGTVDVPVPSYMGAAAFGVLWCDMPPAQDDHIRVPSGTLTVDGLEVELPCAGRGGSPPVSGLVPLPPGTTGVLRIFGDLPGEGGATLALYTEGDPYAVTPPPGSSTDAPPLEDGAHALDLAESRPSVFAGQRWTEAFSVGPQSTIRVWAGRAGSVAVNADGVPATDDGDVAAVLAMMADLSPEQLGGTEHIPFGPDDYLDWSTQQPDLRDGRWLVPVPGAVRTFELPAAVRPAPGERRTVVVEVIAEHAGDHLQVSVADAAPVELDAAPVTADPDPQAPEHVLGHRLVASWEVPSDGHVRELLVQDPADLPDELLLLLARDPGTHAWFGWGEGVAGRGEEAVPLILQGDLDTALRELHQPWFEPLPDGPGPLMVSAPPAVGHPPATVLAYAAVPYEEFDFAAAAPPPGARPAGSPAPPDSQFGHLPAGSVQAVVGPDDLDDGRVTVRLTHGQGLAARITTEGRGRIRFLVEGQPGDALHVTDGWWSSWTDDAVTTDLEIAYAGGYTRPEIDVTLVVEDYEDFTIELLTH